MGYLHRFIADKFLRREDARGRKRSLPVVRISSIGIGMGVTLILLSLFIVRGFKSEIRAKINGFVGNIKIFHPENAYGQYTLPIDIHPELLSALSRDIDSIPGTNHLYTFADLMGVVKTDSLFKGVNIHGVDSLYDKAFLQQYLLDGEVPSFSGEVQNELLLSAAIADYLSLDVDSTMLMYFFDGDRLKVRKFVVKGIYHTGFDDYDNNIVIGDIRCVRGVLGWEATRAGGLEAKLSDYRHTESLYDSFYDTLSARVTETDERYTMLTAQEMNPLMFGWIDLLDTNVALILALMIAVAAMTMITGVIVIILERVRTIATLKALGQRNSSLRKVFHHMALRVLLTGVLWGNMIALALAFIQAHFKLLRLDASQYYMEYVPISISLPTLIVTDLATILILYLIIFIPTAIISNIRPAEGVRFE